MWQESLENNGKGKSEEDKTWKWKNAFFQEKSSSPPHQGGTQKHHTDHTLDLPAAFLGPLFANTNFDRPDFWMSGEGDAWLDQMDNLVGSLEMEVRIPMQRITRRSGGKSETKRDSSGRKMDGRIRILKKFEPHFAKIPVNKVDKMPDNIQKSSNAGVRLNTRLLNIEKALRILRQNLN